MKKLLLGAMMSALFVMNADAGIFSSIKTKVKSAGSSIKNKVIQVQHKIKKDRTMDEKTEIQPFKMYLKNIIKAASEFYKILEDEEKGIFKPSQDNISKFVIFARTAYNKKVTTYDENTIKECINGIKGNFVLSVLDNHRDEKQCKDFIVAVGNAIDFAQNLEKKYSDNKVLTRVVDGLIEIEKFVTGEEARLKAEEAARLEALAEANRRQAEAERQAEEDYNFRLQEAARLEALAEVQRQAEEESNRQVEADAKVPEEAEKNAQMKAYSDPNLSSSSQDLSVDYGVTQSLDDLSRPAPIRRRRR